MVEVPNRHISASVARSITSRMNQSNPNKLPGIYESSVL